MILFVWVYYWKYASNVKQACSNNYIAVLKSPKNKKQKQQKKNNNNKGMQHY